MSILFSSLNYGPKSNILLQTLRDSYIAGKSLDLINLKYILSLVLTIQCEIMLKWVSWQIIAEVLVVQVQIQFSE